MSAVPAGFSAGNTDNSSPASGGRGSRFKQQVQNLQSRVLVSVNASRQPERRPATIALGDNHRQLLDAHRGVLKQIIGSIAEAACGRFGSAEGWWA